MQEGTKKLRALIGAYAGEIREYPASVAQRLEQDGRAQDPELPYTPNTATAPEIDFDAYNAGFRARRRDEILAAIQALDARAQASGAGRQTTTKGGTS